MASPVVILEGKAKRYALAAIEAERSGNYEAAIANLRKAIDALSAILRNYPDHPFNQVYSRLLAQYQRKIRQLERKASLIPLGEDSVSVEVEGGGGEGPPPGVKLEEKPRVSFDDIAGLDDAKRAIREAIIYPVRRPDLFPLGWPRGILLFGPPGTGKTMLAAAVASEIDGEFLYVDAASIMSKWLGEGEKNVKRLFDYARRRAREGKPVIIFIDEIDALLGVYANEVGGEVRVRNQFLKEMDGLHDKDSSLHVYVIGATNKPWALDEPFIRRFQKRIYVPLPDREARRRILEMLTRRIRLAGDVDLDELADMLEGYSGSDIRDIVQDAYMATIREFFEGGGEGDPRPVSMGDFREAIARRRPSVNRDMIRLYEEWSRRHGAH